MTAPNLSLVSLDRQALNTKLQYIAERIGNLDQSGTFPFANLSYDPQAANLVFAAPDTATAKKGVPSFRALTSSDLPAIPDAKLTSNVALLDRNAQVFTGSYSEFVQIGVGGPPTAGQVHVIGAAATTTNALHGSGTTTAASYIQLDNTGGDAVFGVESAGTGSLTSGDLAYSTVISANTNTALCFGTNSTLRMTIDASGNLLMAGGNSVLFATASPGATLNQFVYLPNFNSSICAKGTPPSYGAGGGTPSGATCFDRLSHVLWIYDGSTWRSVTLT